MLLISNRPQRETREFTAIEHDVILCDPWDDGYYNYVNRTRLYFLPPGIDHISFVKSWFPTGYLKDEYSHLDPK